MDLDHIPHQRREETVNTILEVLGVTIDDARKALRSFRSIRAMKLAPNELHIPINKNLDLYLFGMKVVIDGETETIFVKEVR